MSIYTIHITTTTTIIIPLKTYAHCDFGLFQMTIHSGIDTHDSALDDCAILEFNRHLLAIELL
jgi:hypothetical protein